MGRLHLFEFNDQSWLPDVLRDAETGYLEAISRKFKIHEHIAPVVQDALARSGAEQVVDLCSGGVGPLLEIRARLDREVPFHLTDKFPNETAFKAIDAPGVTAVLEPVDAMDVPARLTGLRTIFNALHHFRPQHARAILADAWEKDAPIVVVELSDRTAANILTAPLIVLFVLLFMPTVRPMRWQYLVLTYLIPVIPWLIFWDGLVSHLRVYSTDELGALVAPLDKPGYTWEIKRVPAGPGIHLTCLTGLPASP